jgi:iron complex transport system substrate-binding protein
MRIVSLLPSATEILFAIGAGDQVVGVTHECDYPPAAGTRPALTRDLLPAGLSSAEIDAAVASGIRDQHTIYALDEQALEAVAADLVIAQRLCDVCAVPVETVDRALCTIAPNARVVAADPQTLTGLASAVRAVGAAAGMSDGAERLAGELTRRLDAVTAAVTPHPRRRVAVLEWTDPPWVPGHWVPDMVDRAGGRCLLGASGERSRRTTWDALADVDADVVVAALCGFDLPETIARIGEVEQHPAWRRLTADARVIAVDGSAYFSRPGPRLIDGVELLAWVLHGVGARPPGGRAAELVDGTWTDAATAHSSASAVV